MPRLSKAELAQHRAWLSEWRTPAAMTAYVAAVNNAMGSASFFRQGGLEFLLACRGIRPAPAEHVRPPGGRTRAMAGFRGTRGDVIKNRLDA
jgi:hypothetical protein